jgi:hypothetical protein
MGLQLRRIRTARIRSVVPSFRKPRKLGQPQLGRARGMKNPKLGQPARRLIQGARGIRSRLRNNAYLFEALAKRGVMDGPRVPIMSAYAEEAFLWRARVPAPHRQKRKRPSRFLSTAFMPATTGVYPERSRRTPRWCGAGARPRGFPVSFLDLPVYAGRCAPRRITSSTTR